MDKTEHQNLNWSPELGRVDDFEQIRVRCPECFQSFRVKTHGITQARPKFACSGCDTQFWLPFPEAKKQKELIGFPVSWLTASETLKAKGKKLNKEDSQAVSVGLKDCPLCEFENPSEELECLSCGVIFEKYESRRSDKEEGVRSSPFLRDMWQGLLADFENLEKHEEFLSHCQQANALSYASQRYSLLEQAIGSDELVDSMKKRLQSLSEASFTLKKEPNVEPRSSRGSFMRPKRHWFRTSNVALCISAAIITIGIVFPEGRNLIGVGAAMGFLTLAARFSLR